MWIRIRISATKGESQKDVVIPDLSKLTTIKTLREKIYEVLGIAIEKQQLLFRGKLLIDDHTLFDYEIGHDKVIQLVLKTEKDKNSTSSISNSENDLKENSISVKSSEVNVLWKEISQSHYFKVGEIVDAKDDDYGAWFESKIIRITVLVESDNSDHPENLDSSKIDENVQYVVVFLSYEENGEITLPFSHLRRRARKILNFKDISIGDTIMVNYNMEEPNERGYWYDCIVTKKSEEKKLRRLLGTVLIGVENTEYKDCAIKFLDEIFCIEKNVPLSDRTADDTDTAVIRKCVPPSCEYCKDRPAIKCKKCSCSICGKKEDEDKQLLCDECNNAYHIWCLKPPLSAVPDIDYWYCPDCKNDADEVVKPGEKLKESKKRQQMPSASSKSTRDWGKGMACAGRTKICTIVPTNHFGPIPGVEVGSCWKYRLQVSEVGVHRPMVAGISGSHTTGAYSIVLSGGYEDDKDDGDEFTYTGSGGRSLTGNKRTAAQSCDQVLDKLNLALARNCNAPLNKNTGAEATDWKKGKPVRVVRNYKGHLHSKYCPEEGNRYDGIYKVVKYWPEKGQSGFIVWRYLLKRDDAIPAPWTKSGKKRINDLGLTIEYPDGYLESLEAKKKMKKRALSLGEESDEPVVVKKKKVSYKLSNDTINLIDQDEKNVKLWKECIAHASNGHTAFLDQVKIQFECICCQDILSFPVTTKCNHNVCQDCLKRSFEAKVFSCPLCRETLDRKSTSEVNQRLQKILLHLFPMYKPVK